MCEIRLRDSFDSFGDDLCELLLSYLSLNDCFGLQCVSKLFNSLIFNRQTRIHLTLSCNDCNCNSSKSVVKDLVTEICVNPWFQLLSRVIINHSILAYVLKKCFNITYIIFEEDIYRNLCDKTLTIITDNCKRLKYLKIKFIENKISLTCFKIFAENCLKNLVSLEIKFVGVDYGNEFFRLLIPLTPKIKSINAQQTLIDENISNIIENWNQIEAVNNYEIPDNNFIRFADNFAHKLKSFSIILQSKEITNYDVLKHLSRFKKLEFLHLENCCSDKMFPLSILNSLKYGINRLENLRILGIKGATQAILYIICEEIKSLKKFYVQTNGTIEWKFLKNFSNLKHLTIKYTGDNLDENCFENIYLYLPQVHSIHIELTYFRANLLLALQKIQTLQELKFNYNYSFNQLVFKGNFFSNENTTKNIITFIENCKSIRNIEFFIPKKDTYSMFKKAEIVNYIISKKKKIHLMFYFH